MNTWVWEGKGTMSAPTCLLRKGERGKGAGFIQVGAGAKKARFFRQKGENVIKGKTTETDRPTRGKNLIMKDDHPYRRWAGGETGPVYTRKKVKRGKRLAKQHHARETAAGFMGKGGARKGKRRGESDNLGAQVAGEGKRGGPHIFETLKRDLKRKGLS